MVSDKLKHVLLFFAPVPLFGYSYYYSDTFSSINTSNWTQNGSLSAGSSGLTGSSDQGGSLISSLSVPDTPGLYEVKTTLNLIQNGGIFVSYLEASSNALSGGAGSGSYYAVELQFPSFSNGACSATLALYKRVNGVVTLLSSTSVVCASTTVIRAVRSQASQFAIYVNDFYAIWAQDGDLTSGQPGVGVRGSPVNSIARADLGKLDEVAPAAVSSSHIGTSSFPNRVDIQWQGTVDNIGGIGLGFYEMWKNGGWIAGLSNAETEFSDATLVPGTAYTYQIKACDYHLNCVLTPFSVTTPPAGSVDPRRVGVRPTGA